MARNPNKRRCGAPTRSGRPCRRWAVRGRRRCKLHRGATLRRSDLRRPPGRAQDTDLQARRARIWTELRERWQHLERWIKFDSLDREVVYLKFQFESLLSVATSHDDPRLVSPDGRDIAGDLVERISRLVYQRHRMLFPGRKGPFPMSVADLDSAMLAMDDLIAEFIPPERQQAAHDRFLSLLDEIQFPAV